ACNGCVETAPGPLRLAARPDARGRRYSREFAVEVAVNKYLDHLPLERQARVMSREGLTIESQTLWDQIEALATALQPTYDTLREYVLAAPVIGADETWWRLLGGPESKRWWAWGVTREDAVMYTIVASRSRDAGRRRQASRPAPTRAVDAPRRGDPRLGASAARAPGKQPGQGDRVHAGPVAWADTLPRRRAHPAGQQRHRARAPGSRGRPQESLRLALPARERGRRALLQPHRVGEALRRGTEGLPSPGDARRARDAGHRHPPARAPVRLRSG